MQSKPRILWLNSIFVVSTFVAAAVLVPYQLAATGFRLAEFGAMAALWFLVILAITTGYHRLWSHRSWMAPAPIRAILAVVGAAAYQNHVIAWAADHRRHHRFTDQDDDPYDARRGFWYSHVGWVLFAGRNEGDTSNVPDLVADPVLRWQQRHYFAIATIFNLVVPALLGLLTGRVLEMMLWAGLVRIVAVHHSTFCINSLAHILGSQEWSTSNSSRDSGVVALITVGEGYHNYHHTFQSDYRNGVRWYHYDPGKWTIWSLARLGLATELRRSPVDLLLHRRFESMRERYSHSIAAARAATRDRIDQAERRFEEALARFRATREHWSQLSALKGRAARAALHEARLELEAALEEWMAALQLAMAPA